jgi:predicted nuclease with RNAse H fold
MARRAAASRRPVVSPCVESRVESGCAIAGATGIRAPVSYQHLWRRKPQKCKTRHEGRALLPAEAGEIVDLTITSFPKIEPPVNAENVFSANG